MYNIIFSTTATKHALKLRKSEPTAYKKLDSLLRELETHPRTGTGQVEQLKHLGENIYSRRISKKHRLAYQIQDDIVQVLLISAYGHYDNK